MSTRSTLYRIASLLGDLHAIEKGKVPQRIVRRIVYRHSFRMANWINKVLGVRR